MAWLLHPWAAFPFRWSIEMPSRNVGSKRKATRDAEVPAELAKREAQDRAGSRSGSGRARSPIDAKHVDAPKRQDNERGHRRKRET
jgi:hypothetical protein